MSLDKPILNHLTRAVAAQHQQGLAVKIAHTLTNAHLGLKLSVLQPASSTVVRWMDGKSLPAIMTPEGASCALRIF